jgi:hypothetical protein
MSAADADASARSGKAYGGTNLFNHRAFCLSFRETDAGKISAEAEKFIQQKNVFASVHRVPTR